MFRRRGAVATGAAQDVEATAPVSVRQRRMSKRGMYSMLVLVLSVATLTQAAQAARRMLSEGTAGGDQLWAELRDLPQELRAKGYTQDPTGNWFKLMARVNTGLDATEVPEADKLVVRALAGPPDGSDVGKGWLVSSMGPSEAAAASTNSMDPWSWGTPRLTLEGMQAMVARRGYSLEKHITVTGDGYRLVTFRIPHGKGDAATPGSGAPRQPVLLLHGISLASTCWVVNEQSLAFLLADQGYDVWMINTRGNTFSREHEKFSTEDANFWRFSMDELAEDDLPAVIDYVLMVTKASKVHLVGHSQGATIALALLAVQPQYANKVGITVAIAPVVYVKYLESLTLSAFCTQAKRSALIAALPPQEFLFMGASTQALFLNGVCQAPPTTPICAAATEAMFGTSSHITTAEYRRYWQSWPSATSFWNALQWSQLYNSPEPSFRHFNNGPEYDLLKIKAPVIMISAGQDVLSTPNDVQLVVTRLSQAGTLRGTTHIPDYSHMDFIWDLNAPARVYGVVSTALNTFTV